MVSNMTKLQLYSLNALTILSLLLLLPVLVSCDCKCDAAEDKRHNKAEALKYKIGAIASILIASGIGVCIPILANKFQVFRPENDVFFIIKAFAAGVILSTGFVHILPDGFDKLRSPCLNQNVWKFPFTGFIAMMSAIGTLMVDTFATIFYKRLHFNKAQPVTEDEEKAGEHSDHLHVHTHAINGHSHGSTSVSEGSVRSELIRHRIVSQVLELGIVVHSLIIGVSLGASRNPQTIKPLFVALTFHQFFEGMGLGGCISQARFGSRPVAAMALFFSLTTPVGIILGIGITNTYNENSLKALVIEGVLDSAAAGILIYMALVDLLAADFMNSRMQNNWRLQFGANISLLLGTGCMSILAKWA
ncbi:zinc transporter 1-like isoform X1 [Telopea speciosissima]|uniref:zinc transporter 1-like isoform X1 n=1 Tax=Telopea speciosissima TaxID=54955 RepID=UPI001CC3B138|nr:zinc transporter 1-like isoform X1 [Telopea speciosissima]